MTQTTKKKEKQKKVWQPTFKRSFFWSGPDGWEDLGQKESFYINKQYAYTTHEFCGTRIHIGKRNGILFWFCPRCMVQVKVDGKLRIYE